MLRCRLLNFPSPRAVLAERFLRHLWPQELEALLATYLGQNWQTMDSVLAANAAVLHPPRIPENSLSFSNSTVVGSMSLSSHGSLETTTPSLRRRILSEVTLSESGEHLPCAESWQRARRNWQRAYKVCARLGGRRHAPLNALAHTALTHSKGQTQAGLESSSRRPYRNCQSMRQGRACRRSSKKRR